MKCPGCNFAGSPLRDICPKCFVDLRPHKRGLGLRVVAPNSTYEELLAKARRVAERNSPRSTSTPEAIATLSGIVKGLFGGILSAPQNDSLQTPTPLAASLTKPQTQALLKPLSSGDTNTEEKSQISASTAMASQLQAEEQTTANRLESQSPEKEPEAQETLVLLAGDSFPSMNFSSGPFFGWVVPVTPDTAEEETVEGATHDASDSVAKPCEIKLESAQYQEAMEKISNETLPSTIQAENIEGNSVEAPAVSQPEHTSYRPEPLTLSADIDSFEIERFYGDAFVSLRNSSVESPLDLSATISLSHVDQEHIALLFALAGQQLGDTSRPHEVVKLARFEENAIETATVESELKDATDDTQALVSSTHLKEIEQAPAPQQEQALEGSSIFMAEKTLQGVAAATSAVASHQEDRLSPHAEPSRSRQVSSRSRKHANRGAHQAAVESSAPSVQSIPRHVTAGIIDLIVVCGAAVLIASLFDRGGLPAALAQYSISGFSEQHEPLIDCALSFLPLSAILYFFSTFVWLGTSLGGLICSLALVTEHGRQPKLRHIAVRSAAVPLGFLTGGFLPVFFGKRSLPDRLARTAITRYKKS